MTFRYDSLSNFDEPRVILITDLVGKRSEVPRLGYVVRRNRKGERNRRCDMSEMGRESLPVPAHFKTTLSPRFSARRVTASGFRKATSDLDSGVRHHASVKVAGRHTLTPNCKGDLWTLW